MVNILEEKVQAVAGSQTMHTYRCDVERQRRRAIKLCSCQPVSMNSGIDTVKSCF